MVVIVLRSMRAFTCPVCRHLVTFESTSACTAGRRSASTGTRARFVALARRPCANRELIGCNSGAGPVGCAAACALTRTRPADDDARRARAAAATAEAAKRRLVFELLELGLPVDGGLQPSTSSPARRAGHDRARRRVITLDLAEADPVARERTRARELDEPYRTVLGHLRHEIGHYYQPILAPEGSTALERCRALMGDDREDYAAALERHYADGPPRRLARALRLGLRDHAPLGGLGRGVRPLPAHPRRAADRDRLRRDRRRPAGGGRRGAAVLQPGGRAGDFRACSTPGSRSATRSTRSAAASATTTSTRSCSRRRDRQARACRRARSRRACHIAVSGSA